MHMTDALRFNAGKPELDYVLTFQGGTAFAFEGSVFQPAVAALARWYCDDDTSPAHAVDAFLAHCGSDWPEQLARVSMHGASKYAVGNYLRGMSWRNTINSLLRHVRAIDRGEEIDPESGCSHRGAVAWNALYLYHLTQAFPEKDDRIRASTTLAEKVCETPHVAGAFTVLLYPVTSWRYFQDEYKIDYDPYTEKWTIGNAEQGISASTRDLVVCLAALRDGRADAITDEAGVVHRREGSRDD